MFKIANNILNNAYEHYKSTNSLIYYYTYPQNPNIYEIQTSLDYLEEKGYVEIQGKAIGSCYIKLTDKAISRFE